MSAALAAQSPGSLTPPKSVAWFFEEKGRLRPLNTGDVVLYGDW
jgi:hypothetical protein